MAAAVVGFHASHEQFPPSLLLRLVRQAEREGFRAAMCSDHFHPWYPSQGQSGYAWSWLGAALATTRLSFGVVCAPGYRYHPAVVAQKIATLGEMFPGRFWCALGSGEALNEHITGAPWPEKAERNARLRESVDVIRALLAGETVTHEGRVRVDRAKLYTRPRDAPPLVGAATTPETARWLAGFADGLITISKPLPQMREIVDAWRAGGGAGKPMLLQAQVSYAEDMDKALEAARARWRFAALGGKVLWDLETPEAIEEATRSVRGEDLRDDVAMGPDLAWHARRLREYAALGFERIYVHQVAADQESFLRDFGREVLPAVEAA